MVIGGFMYYGRYLMSFIENNVFLDKDNAIANLGDNIQALAMDYIYQKLGIKKEQIAYIKRDFGKEYCGEEVKLLFYSEFSRDNIFRRLSISEKIKIMGVISAVFYDDIVTLEKEYINIYKFLKEQEPIGCRDEKTRNYLRSVGIEAYLMGCFTLCFPKREKVPEQEKIFFVDTPKELEKHIPLNIKEHSEYLTHEEKFCEYPVNEEENRRLDIIAKNLLERYKNEATLVVTGRLHAALPCIAMGIPVILTCNNLDFRFGWIEKFIKPYQLGEYEKIDWNPSIVNLEQIKSIMISLCTKLLSGDKESAINEFTFLDNYYNDREKIKPYKIFREKILKIFENERKDKCKYVLWGAGYHARYAYDIISQINPCAKLVAVVDKYKEGKFHNIPIKKEKDLEKVDFDYLFITTVPGSSEAENWIKNNRPTIKYTFITSQHKS